MSDTAPIKLFGPYSPVRQAGAIFFISGQVGVDPATGTAAVDIAAQTHQALANMSAVLGTAGLAPADVVKTTLYLTDMQDFALVNEIYAAYFTHPRPARCTVGVRALPAIAGSTPLKIEIEAVASKGQSSAHEN